LAEENKTKGQTPWFKDVHMILTIILIAFFIISLYPQSGIILKTNNLILLAFVVVLVLSHRFKEIQIPGFLKLSQALESVKEETQELRNILIQVFTSLTSIAQAQAVSQASTTVNINTLGDQARELNERIETEEITEERTRVTTQRTDEERIFDYFKNGDYVATFSVLRHLLEEQLINILSVNQLSVPRQGIRALNEIAYKNEVITYDIFSGIDIVRITANKFIHPFPSEEYYPIEKLEYIVNLGMTVYHQLLRLTQNT